MKTSDPNSMKTNEIDILMKEKGNPCITIIIPTDRINHKSNYEALKKAVQKMKGILKARSYSRDIQLMLVSKAEQTLQRLPEEIQGGLGFYISQNHSFIVTFPFNVTTKIEVSDKFELRDILHLKQYAIPYYVLNLSKHGVHLFKGMLDELVEVKDGKFPFTYDDQFEYQRASIANSSSSSLKGFEKEKSEIIEVRLKSVFREADAHMKAYLGGDSKILVAGSQKLISAFLEITQFNEHFSGKISGSFNDNNVKLLGERAWETLIRNKKREEAKLIKALQEKANGHLAEGLQHSWIAALEGKGKLLVVEKDFHHRGYMKPDQYKLLLQTPAKPYTVIPDAVDELIETVRAKNGEVVFTENDQLKDFDHLALVLRY